MDYKDRPCNEGTGLKGILALRLLANAGLGSSVPHGLARWDGAVLVVLELLKSLKSVLKY